MEVMLVNRPQPLNKYVSHTSTNIQEKDQRSSINPEVEIPCIWLIKYMCISLQYFLKNQLFNIYPYINVFDLFVESSKVN